MSKGVSKVSERASECGGASKRVSSVSGRANGRASGPVLQSGFFVILDHSAMIRALHVKFRRRDFIPTETLPEVDFDGSS